MTPFDEISKKAVFLNDMKDLIGCYEVRSGDKVLITEAQFVLEADLKALIKEYIKLGEWV